MPQQPTPEAKEDFNALLEALIPFAEEMLKKHGEFFPFGAAVSAAGEVSAHATYEGSENPASEEVIAGLVQTFQAEARTGAIRATGICYDGRIVQNGKKVDAAIIGLEHISGCASKTCVRYSKSMFGKYRFGDFVAALDEPMIFVNT